MLRKCIIEIADRIVWAQPGIPAKGNMKPDGKIEGRIEKKLTFIACIWLRATAEIRTPALHCNSGLLLAKSGRSALAAN